jgi:hypothetical protein
MIARIKKTVLLALGASLAMTALGVAPASAVYGFSAFDVKFLNADGTPAGVPATQAGSHPYAMVTTFEFNKTGGTPDGKAKDILVEQLTGFVGDGTMPPCSTADFLAPNPKFPSLSNLNLCPNGAAVGVADINLGGGLFGLVKTAPIYNLLPPPGAAARIGFRIRGIPAMIDVVPKEGDGYNLIAGSRNVSAAVSVFGVNVMLWGIPADPAHDYARGECAQSNDADEEFSLEDPGSTETCPSNALPQPFITLPRSCGSSPEDIETSYETTSWEEPDVLITGSVFNDTHTFTDLPTDPADPKPFVGCAKLGFDPTITGAATSRAAQSPSGLEFGLHIEDQGLTNPSYDAVAESEIKKAVVTLPEGMTANPSLAEGLEVCTEAQLEAETAASPQGAHCPDGAKIGTVEVESPLIHEKVNGAVYMAEPYKNQFNSLLALYIVIKNKNLGIIVKNKLKVEPDPQTGQLTTTVEDIPQLPFSNFRMRLREGGRSPLISPRDCGSHTIKAVMTPWAGGLPVTETASFEIISGPNEGACPTGPRPFEPGFNAGTANNNAGDYSPFLMRLLRRDGDQDLTRFDAVLPKGMLAKLAGVERCSDAQIASIKTKTGKEELASPSCPANSKIGNVWGGAGAGSQLTYVPGSVYLAGPFAGAPMSVVGVVPAVAGPFDVGVVMTRQALDVDPVSGVASVNGEKSDPIPHILAGIPLNVRDIQVRVDRPDFTLNPTNCNPLATTSDIWGGGSQLFSTADDSPVGRSDRFQAANCANLGFNPRINLRLFGGTARAKYQAVRAVVRPRPGHANIAGNVVRFPTSAFVAQEHLNNICTRVQWAAQACPKGSVYGRAIARTPLLDDPLRGTVHLRSSDNLLPDLVADLRGPAHMPIKVEVAIKNDSVKGALRATVQNVPDAPVTYFRLQTFGGNKGLIVNSRNICKGKNAARVTFRGQNGKRVVSKVPVRNAKCAKQRKAKRKAAKRRAMRAAARR